jgi:hypothetical protein
MLQEVAFHILLRCLTQRSNNKGDKITLLSNPNCYGHGKKNYGIDFYHGALILKGSYSLYIVEALHEGIILFVSIHENNSLCEYKQYIMSITTLLKYNFIAFGNINEY